MTETLSILWADSGRGLHWGSRQGEAVQDSELADLLEDVALPHLAAKLGGLDAEADWARVLSQGEQQRVAMLRLLLHQPTVAFLDEVCLPAALNSARCGPAHVLARLLAAMPWLIY